MATTDFFYENRLEWCLSSMKSMWEIRAAYWYASVLNCWDRLDAVQEATSLELFCKQATSPNYLLYIAYAGIQLDFLKFFFHELWKVSQMEWCISLSEKQQYIYWYETGI